MPEPLNITLAVTGASGSIYAAEILRALAADARVTKINFVASDSSLRVFAEELNLSGRNDLAENSSVRPAPNSRPTLKPTSAPTSPAAATPPTP